MCWVSLCTLASKDNPELLILNWPHYPSHYDCWHRVPLTDKWKKIYRLKEGCPKWCGILTENRIKGSRELFEMSFAKPGEVFLKTT